MTTPTAVAESEPEPTSAKDVSPDTARALVRISVGRPYFALDDVELVADGMVRATVPPGPPVGPERGAVAARQVARHLAILGSCAASLSRDDDVRHHYLATQAEYERLPTAPIDPVGEPLRAEARSCWVDKRTARAETQLMTCKGTVLNRLVVQYAVMKPRMFERLNPSPDPGTTGQRHPDRGLRVVDPGHVVRACGAIEEVMCAGHFPGHPTAPVALVMGRLVATAADAMSSHLGADVDYVVEGGTVDATGLARAGQDLVLEAHHVEQIGDVHSLHGIASADGAPIGTVEVRLSPIER